MPTLTGYISASGAKHDGSNIGNSPAVSGFVEANTQPAIVDPASEKLSGSITAVIFAPMIAGLTGLEVRRFTQYYYNRIWVIPAKTDFGNVLSEQTISIEVWNSYFTSKVLSSVTATGLDGVTLIGPTAKTFAALESTLYSLKVAAFGNPTFDGYYEWAFPSELVRSYASGKRVVVFPFRVNTAGGIKETLQWVTTVTPKKRAQEQRRRLRKNPRRKIEYNHTFFNQNERQLFRALMFGWMARTFALPIWLDRTRLTSELAAGATSLAMPTTYLDYDLGGFVMFYDAYNNFEIVEITGVASGLLEFKATQNTWPVGSEVIPTRLATLSPELTSDMHKRNFETATLLWQIQNAEVSSNRIANASYDTYKGYPVYAQSNDWASAIEVTSRSKEQVLDAMIGPYNIMPETNGVTSATPFNLLFGTRQKIAEFVGFLYARAGKYNPVWLPSYQDDFTVKTTVASNATTIDVEQTGYSVYYQTHSARRDICIIRPNGQRYYRRITGVSAPTGQNKDVLSIDADLGFSITPGDGTRISFLYLCRLDQDNVELTWLTDDKATSRIAFTDLIETP